ncbi:hypothetical protein D3C75_1096370 [compost metagenome]
MFTRTQALYRSRVGGVTGKMKTADPLHRHDLPGNQRLCGQFQRIVGAGGGLACGIAEPQVRATLRAGGRLCMKTTVGRILILRQALRAQRKRLH